MDIVTYGLLNKKKANIDSPHFTGEPTAPTPDLSDDSERLATTEYVNDAIEAAGPHTVYDLTREGRIVKLSGSDHHESEIELPYMCMTSAEWREEGVGLVSEPGALYIWSDYREDGEGNYIPGVKIGDGNAYVLDLPFQDADYLSHILNEDIHVTAAQKSYWNNKVTCYVPVDRPTTMVFTKENIVEI